MVGMFVGGQGRPCRKDLAKALDLGLKGERGERRTGMVGNKEFETDFVCVGGDKCWERERRVRR